MNTSTLKARAVYILQSSAMKIIALAALRLTFGVLTSRAIVFDEYAPFGLAYAAASVAAGGITGAAGVVGVVLGYISTFELTDGIKYLAGTALALTAILAFKGTRLSRRAYFPPSAAALAIAAVGFVYAVGKGSAASAALFVTEVMLAFAFTYFTGLARRYKGADTNPLCILIFAAVLLLGAQDVTLIAGISAAKLAAVIAVLLAARYGGAGAGAACGVTFGVIFDIGGGGGFYSMTYGIGGLAAGALNGGARLYGAAAYVLISGALALIGGTRGLYETFAASVIYMLLPERLPLRSFFALLGDAPTLRGVSDDTPPRLAALSDAYASLACVLQTQAAPPPTAAERDAVYTRAARRTCATCPRVAQCWQSGFALHELRAADDTLHRNARLRSHDLSDALARVCNRAADLCDSISEEYRVGQLERRAALREAQDRARLAEQYSLTARVLASALSPTQTASPLARAAHAPRVGAHSRRRRSSPMSGDRGAWFVTPHGETVVMLSDGMGSGEAAAAQSAELLGLAEKLIRGGMSLCDTAAALETVLAARGGASFATLDVLRIGTGIGGAEMIKCGAAPTYVRLRGVAEESAGEASGEVISRPMVTRIEAAGLPPGTNVGVPPTAATIEGGSADLVVMVTDGATDGGDDTWLRELVLAHNGEPAELARKITSGATADDDVSAIVVAL